MSLSSQSTISRWTLLSSALAALLLLSCADRSEVDVLVTGQLSIPDCVDPEFVWQPEFATFARGTGSAGIIRIQSSSGPLDNGDHIALNLRDGADVRARLGEAIELEPLSMNSTVVGTMNLHGRCPSSRSLSTVMEGTVTFTEFSGQTNSIVEGIAEFSLVDARDTTRVVAEDMRAEFRFRILKYPPYQPFNAAPN